MSTGFRKDRSSFYNGRKKLWRSSANLAGREKSDDSIQEFVFAIERILEFSIIYFFSIIDFILSLYLRIRLIFSSSNSFDEKWKIKLGQCQVERYTRAHTTHTRVREFSHQDYRVSRAGRDYIYDFVYTDHRDSSVPILNVHIRSASTRRREAGRVG